MEKTDTIILSPEELAAYMAESTISVTSTYEHSPVVLMVDDTVIGTLGNFSASIGKAKSKKTFNVSAIVASALSGSTVLHYRSTFPENKRKILYIDTEQGRYHCQLVLKRILRLADLPEYKNPDNLIMLTLRKFSPKLRLAIVEQAMAMVMMRRVMPPAFISSPASMKKGTASSGKLLAPSHMFWMMSCGSVMPM